MRRISNSSGTPWGTVPSTCRCHSRDLGSELLREVVGPQALGCRQCLIPSLEAGAVERSAHAYKRCTLVEEMYCPF